MALGYPLVNDLLIRLWEWDGFPNDLRIQLEKVIRFHHPNFDPSRRTSYPNIELLLTEMMANEELFYASRSAPGKFSLKELLKTRQDLLQSMSSWFHSIYDLNVSKAQRPNWLNKFRSKLKPEDTLVSFNWDLVLEHLLYGAKLGPHSYGFGPNDTGLPTILKPHGSLNWFYGETGKNLKEAKRFLLEPKEGESVLVFKRYREPKTKVGRAYMPAIIPPVLNKSFEKGVPWETWQRTVGRLSVAKSVVFLGYSMPDADMHGRFIMRCGFYNQLHGEIRNGTRSEPTGAASVVIVNPDRGAASRIESAVAGTKCVWEPTSAEQWIDNQ